MPRRPRPAAAAEDLVDGFADLLLTGRGTVSTSYRAVESSTGRPVGLEVVEAVDLHPELAEVFDREVQLLAAVSDHPNVVTLYRVASTRDGRRVLVLELCPSDLAERMATSGPMTASEVLRVGTGMAEALESAHRIGLLHRGIEPRRIAVTRFGGVALGGFAVTALQASGPATGGAFEATSPHTAPEILEGGDPTPATDVYGLASTLHHLLSGHAPFALYGDESPASVILRILRDPVRPVISADVPIELADLLVAAMAKRPGDRPASASEFAAALRDMESGMDGPAAVESVRASSVDGPPPGAVRGRASAAAPGGRLVEEVPLPPLRPTRPSLVRPGEASRSVVVPPVGEEEWPSTTVPPVGGSVTDDVTDGDRTRPRPDAATILPTTEGGGRPNSEPPFLSDRLAPGDLAHEDLDGGETAGGFLFEPVERRPSGAATPGGIPWWLVAGVLSALAVVVAAVLIATGLA